MSLAEIPPMERGRLRLFAINKTEDEARAILAEGTHAIQTLLGANDLNPDFIELFRVADLGDMGLDDYLHTGYDIPRAQLDPQAGRLRALEGYVLVVLSLAFRDLHVTLPDTPDLTLIGTFGAPAAEWSTTETITSAAAEPYSGPPKASKPVSDAAMSGRVATVALLVIFLITGLVVWIA
ncbi:hypothetical protein [Pseudosulfitobacter sp. DSM 107133]|uniref:hypothetical protein n=1 Tax=Pseudosulfitobacter sp. DSM 107133 TaxID=2883100 RepID=UPI0013B433B2|nr:hypothetical protein [Pseudosulfitobacter sp. DSM 107133]UOA28159.1 hypothetical protein DSM107133_02904 [Pseudosulfitobacter sp. DSM 107133]